MSSVKQRDTKPEMKVRRILHRIGLRYRLHDKKLPGSPDLVFPRFRAVLFVHGCFWHSHGCKGSTVAQERRAFWEKKFKYNLARDAKNITDLTSLGWRVLVVWECATKHKGIYLEELALKITKWLRSEETQGELP